MQKEIDLFNKSLAELSVPLRIKWQEEADEMGDLVSMRLFGHKEFRFRVQTTQDPPFTLKSFLNLSDAKKAVFNKMVEANQQVMADFAKEHSIH
jgi:hypothetical protein